MFRRQLEKLRGQLVPKDGRERAHDQRVRTRELSSVRRHGLAYLTGAIILNSDDEKWLPEVVHFDRSRANDASVSQRCGAMRTRYAVEDELLRVPVEEPILRRGRRGCGGSETEISRGAREPERLDCRVV